MFGQPNARYAVPAVVALAVAVLHAGGHGQAPAATRDYPFQPVPFTAVKLTDEFWAPRIEVNRTATVPVAFEQCERTNRVDLFVRAAQVLRGEEPANRKPPGYPFDDTDVYKVIEGAAYTLRVHPDPKLDAYVDGLIAKIAAAQEPDGYLYTTRTIDPKQPHLWAGPERWVLERDDSHELYNLGHLFEAATAHHLATGKRSLLDVAVKSADLLVRTFGPGKRSIWPGHQITEMGLVKMARVTGKPEYLALAKFLLDERGPAPLPPGERANPRGLDYNQAQQRVVEQTEPVGHAVRAMYMYSGMADVAALTGDPTYARAIDTIWNNTVTKKLYITGGIGASGVGEAFGSHYQLPNLTAYNETCASIGMDYWNHRLFLLHGDAKYIDVMERTLFNGLISGVALDGRTFFYPNPLESRGQHQRSPWFGVACCPSNISRFLPSVPGYVYAKARDAIYVNLYVQGTGEIALDGNRTVKLTQQTRYPWDGAVKIVVAPEPAGTFAINVRIPGWAREEPVPGDLYRFLDTAPPATLKVNGAAVPVTIDKGFVRVSRAWQRGDTIELDLPMPVRRLVAHEKVTDDAGRVALQRGPIVYAAEWPDNAGGRVRNLVLPDASRLTAEFRPALLNGVVVLEARARALASTAAGGVTSTEQDLVAIPYATWANRGAGEMIVWLPRTAAGAHPTPYPTLATAATITASVPVEGRGKSTRPIADGEAPRSSDDPSSYFDWWPTRGSAAEWVEMTFAKPATISESSVYWFDDTGHGSVRVPATWRLLYKDGAGWKPVEAVEGYGVARDRFNRVSFKPITTGALRIEVSMQPTFSAGLQEWTVKQGLGRGGAFPGVHARHATFRLSPAGGIAARPGACRRITARRDADGRVAMTEHAVVIAGGGPTGLMLAGELALAGVDVAVVERRPSQDLAGTRAGGLHARTIEILDQRGIADRFLSQGQVHRVAGFALIPLDISDFPTRHNYLLALAQNHIERILAEWVGELAVTIHRGRDVTGFAQDDAGVDVALSDGQLLRAEYLVGCDGGRSVIRKSAGIEFPGWDATTSWLIAEVEWAEEPAWGFREDAVGTYALGKMENARSVRVVLTERQVGSAGEPTLRDVSEALIAIYGTDYGIHTPTWISRFTDATRQAAAYRDRRVLLAGDAAHVHPPQGGQGLNIGVQDAVNLAWKLAQVVKRTSPDSLLDTYHAERHPVAARILRNTMAQVALRRTDDRTKALSDTVSELLGMNEPRRRIAAEMSGLGVHYDLGSSDINTRHPLLGRRMPDLDLVTANGPLRVFTLLHDARPVLLNLGQPGGFDITPWADRVQSIDATYVGTWELPAIGAVTAPTAVLVRPDGYVAWVGDLAQPGLADALTTWFGPPAAA